MQVRTRSLALGVLLAAAVGAEAQTTQLQVNKDNRTISITANGTVSADAEIANVHIGFTAYGADEQSAYAEGSRRSNAIFAALAAAGVAKKDIQSDNQGVTPVQPYENNNLPESQKKNRNFQVQQSWTVKCAADDAARVLHQAVQAGANNSGAVDWNVKDEDALQARAATKALTSARTVAEGMAKGLGVKLGPLVYASNEAPERPGPMPRMAVMADKRKSAPEPLAIAPRKVEASATVTAIFAIE
jgi:uncharacterized protein YggE